MRRISLSRPEHDPGDAEQSHYRPAALQYGQSYAANGNVSVHKHDTDKPSTKFPDDLDISGWRGLFGSSGQRHPLARGAEQTRSFGP
jgi:hypothetical protein